MALSVEEFFHVLGDKNHGRAFVNKLNTDSTLRTVEENYSFLYQAYAYKRVPSKKAAIALYEKWVKPQPSTSMFSGPVYINIDGVMFEKIKQNLGLDQASTGTATSSKTIVPGITPKSVIAAQKTLQTAALHSVFDDAIAHIEGLFKNDTFAVRRKTYVPRIEKLYQEFKKIAPTLHEGVKKVGRFKTSFFTPD